MVLDNPILLICLLAPAVALWPRIRQEGLPILMSIAIALMITALWSIGVALILAAAQASALPGSLWAFLITALVVTEIVARR